MSNVMSDIMSMIMGNKPKEVDGMGNISSKYYMRKTKRMVLGRFEFTGLPKWWDKMFFYETLLFDGKVCITDYPGLGVTPFQCGEFGVNVFNKPTTVNVSNVYLNTNFERSIGINCALPKVSPDYRGLIDMCVRTSSLLASADTGIYTNFMNTRVAFLFPVSSKKEEKEVAAIYDKVSRGEPYVAFDKQINIAPYTFPVKTNYIASDILMDKRSIWNEFLTDLGINNANTDKKERLNTDEVNANNEEVNLNVQNILECIQEGFDVANQLYDMNLGVRLRTWEEMTESMDSHLQDVEGGEGDGGN